MGRPPDPTLREAAPHPDLEAVAQPEPAHLLHLVDAVSCPVIFGLLLKGQRTQNEAGTQSQAQSRSLTLFLTLPTQKPTPTGLAAIKVGNRRNEGDFPKDTPPLTQFPRHPRLLLSHQVGGFISSWNFSPEFHDLFAAA